MLWVRHHAWLNTTPDKASKPRRESRNQEMPYLFSQAYYLIEILFEIGPVVPVGMGGTIGVSDSDIYYYQKNQKINFTAWECSTIRRLSREYASMMGEAKEPNCPAPFIPFVETLDRPNIAHGFANWAKQLTKS